MTSNENPVYPLSITGLLTINLLDGFTEEGRGKGSGGSRSSTNDSSLSRYIFAGNECYFIADRIVIESMTFYPRQIFPCVVENSRESDTYILYRCRVSGRTICTNGIRKLTASDMQNTGV